ncbi:MAG TPA: oxaloacetate decarboxylase [Candidatus Limnocylindria bacterium]
MKRPAAALRTAIRGGPIVLAPGAYDALSAKVIEDLGFPAVYLGGTVIAAALAGLPDVGLLGAAEIAGFAAHVARAVSIPVICDADAGYGNPAGIMRTVALFEQAGVAAIHIEDEVFPRTRYVGQARQLCSVDEMRARIAAALTAKQDPDFVIIARTDARAGSSFEEALSRAIAYAVEGADMVYVEHLTSREEFVTVAETLRDRASLFANMSEFSRYPLLPAAELDALGYRLVIFPLTTLRAALKATVEVLEEIKRNGTQGGVLDRLAAREEIGRLTGADEALRLEKKYLPPEKSTGE